MTDGVVFIRFPGIYGVLPLITRDCDCSYKAQSYLFATLPYMMFYNEIMLHRYKTNIVYVYT